MDEKQARKFREMTEAPVGRTICRQAVPCIISMLVTGRCVLHDGNHSGHRLLFRARKRQFHLPRTGQTKYGCRLQHGRHGILLCIGRRPCHLHPGPIVSGTAGLSAGLYRHDPPLCSCLSAHHLAGCPLDDGIVGPKQSAPFSG